MSRSSSSPANPYRFTAEVMNRRSRRYRDLVILVVGIWLAMGITALVLESWQPLLGWLLVVPACGLFLISDARMVARWRSTILDGWVAGGLDLDSIKEGLSAIKLLPARTIAGLVDPLPTRARLECFPDPKPLVREALAATVRVIDRLQMNRLVSGVAALTATAALIALAVALGSTWALVGVPLVVGISQAAQKLSLRPPRTWPSRMADWKSRGLDVETFAQLARRLAWESLPGRARERWLSIEAYPSDGKSHGSRE